MLEGQSRLQAVFRVQYVFGGGPSFRPRFVQVPEKRLGVGYDQ